MIKFLQLLLALCGLVVIVMLAVDNRGPVDLVFWPLPFSYQVPLYWVFLFGLIAGALLGGAALWLSNRAERRETRAMRRKLRAVEYEERQEREHRERDILEQARRKTQAIAIEAPRA